MKMKRIESNENKNASLKSKDVRQYFLYSLYSFA